MQRKIEIDKLQQSIEEMHSDVSVRVTESQKRQVDAHNRKTNVTSFNAEVGEFVLIREMKPGRHKLSFHWFGPRRVIEVRSPSTYLVQNLSDNSQEVVHCRRMIRYRASLDSTEVDPRLLEAARPSETTYQIAKRILDPQEKNGVIRLRVEWEGLPDECDYTWENADQVKEDLPELFQLFVTENNCAVSIKNALLVMTN